MTGRGVPISPPVMLSPNARKRVALSFGVEVTCTWNVQEAWRLAESDAVQITSVVPPAGNALPDGIVQCVVSGGVPPVATGGALGDQLA